MVDVKVFRHNEPSFSHLSLLLVPFLGGDARKPTDPDEDEKNPVVERLEVGGAKMDRCRFKFPTFREYCILKSLVSCGLWRVTKSRPPTNLLLLESDLQL